MISKIYKNLKDYMIVKKSPQANDDDKNKKQTTNIKEFLLSQKAEEDFKDKISNIEKIEQRKKQFYENIDREE